ncbi:FeoB-associated Cys-rich membrane protein [Flavobacterium sp.]|uniref:FeoB-associated Cys-rich membrane protein n=1 Tax=Flavobacterium sp. TaxID=239 RepID=UPI0025B90B02|nr:FeoB-associated Cys-rich membrane protein [Flavobacterium sp.]
MQPNYIIVGIVIVAAIALVVYLTKQNRKDQKAYEEYLKNQGKPKTEKDVADGL